MTNRSGSTRGANLRLGLLIPPCLGSLLLAACWTGGAKSGESAEDEAARTFASMSDAGAATIVTRLNYKVYVESPAVTFVGRRTLLFGSPSVVWRRDRSGNLAPESVAGFDVTDEHAEPIPLPPHTTAYRTPVAVVQGDTVHLLWGSSKGPGVTNWGSPVEQVWHATYLRERGWSNPRVVYNVGPDNAEPSWERASIVAFLNRGTLTVLVPYRTRFGVLVLTGQLPAAWTVQTRLDAYSVAHLSAPRSSQVQRVVFSGSLAYRDSTQSGLFTSSWDPLRGDFSQPAWVPGSTVDVLRASAIIPIRGDSLLLIWIRPDRESKARASLEGAIGQAGNSHSWDRLTSLSLPHPADFVTAVDHPNCPDHREVMLRVDGAVLQRVLVEQRQFMLGRSSVTDHAGSLPAVVPDRTARTMSVYWGALDSALSGPVVLRRRLRACTTILQ